MITEINIATDLNPALTRNKIGSAERQLAGRGDYQQRWSRRTGLKSVQPSVRSSCVRLRLQLELPRLCKKSGKPSETPTAQVATTGTEIPNGQSSPLDAYEHEQDLGRYDDVHPKEPPM